MTTTTRPTRNLFGTGEQRDPVAAPTTRTASRRRRPIAATIAVTWLVLLLVAAVFADLLPLPAPDESAGPSALGPFQSWGSLTFGTDRLGRSQLSRVIYGARSSLTVGVASTAIGVVVGGTLGVLAGYFRSKVDAVIGAIANMILTLPGIVLLLAMSAIFTPSLRTLLIGLGLLATPIFFRISRAATMTVASRDFVTAARAAGAGNVRILVKELVPNVVTSMVAYAFVLVAVLITVEGSLSYLGVGIPPPTPSWGGMIANGQNDIRTNPHLLFVPATVMFLTVFALNIVADWLRSVLDVREARS